VFCVPTQYLELLCPVLREGMRGTTSYFESQRRRRAVDSLRAR
jgi:hypothetical protein